MIHAFSRHLRSAIFASFASTAAVIPATAQATYEKPSDIPAEAFASLPKVRALTQSPDGNKVAFLSELDGRAIMIVQNLDGSDRAVQPPIQEANIFAYRWANNERLLVMYDYFTTNTQYVQLRSRETRLAAVNADGTDFAWIIRPSKGKTGNSKFGENLPFAKNQTNVIDMLPDEPNYILVALDGDHDNMSEVRKVDIRDGRFTEIQSDKNGVQGWMTDASGEPRFGWGYTLRGDERVGYWKNSAGEWVRISDADWYDRFDIWDFDGTPDHFLISGLADTGTRGLFRLHIPSGEIVEQLFVHSSVNIDYPVRPDESGAVRAVAYTEDHRQFHFLDKRYAGLHRAMSRALPDYNIEIVDFDHAAGRYLILASNDRQPGIYYQYDRVAKQLRPVSPMRPGMPTELMAGTSRVDIASRDGTIIPSYLTLPVGKEPKNLPAVVLVHGGPQARDDASWDYWAQFLASRGFAVLRPNFRGSRGYGDAFEAAGYHQWGGLMQQDVTDATKQMIDAGVFDADRVCIAGASYGGYAAMMGLVQAGELYACGVSVNGVVDLPKLKRRDDAQTLGSDNWIAIMGLEGADDKDVSPFHQASRIADPVLLMASKDDTRLRWTDTEEFRDRLKSLKKDAELVVIEDGGHWMTTENARLKKLQAMERFLARHIGD